MALSTRWPSSDREWYKDTKTALTWRAACGGQAICERQRPDKTDEESQRLVGRCLSQIAARRSRARQVSGVFKSLVTLVGFLFVFFVSFVVHALGKRS